MTDDILTTPSSNNPIPVVPDELHSSRRASGQIIIAIVFFGLGFVAALLLAQFSNDNTQAIYQTALNDAVAEILTCEGQKVHPPRILRLRNKDLADYGNRHLQQIFNS